MCASVQNLKLGETQSTQIIRQKTEIQLKDYSCEATLEEKGCPTHNSSNGFGITISFSFFLLRKPVLQTKKPESQSLSNMTITSKVC